MSNRRAWGLGCLSSALALLPGGVGAATLMFVAPTGDDANPGTIAQPVATPQGAQARVRALLQAGLSNAVAVAFAAGTYFYERPAGVMAGRFRHCPGDHRQ